MCYQRVKRIEQNPFLYERKKLGVKSTSDVLCDSRVLMIFSQGDLPGFSLFFFLFYKLCSF